MTALEGSSSVRVLAESAVPLARDRGMAVGRFRAGSPCGPDAGRRLLDFLSIPSPYSIGQGCAPASGDIVPIDVYGDRAVQPTCAEARGAQQLRS